MSEVPLWRSLPSASTCSFQGAGSRYTGTSLIKNSAPLGPYSRPMPRAMWWSQGSFILRAMSVKNSGKTIVPLPSAST